MKANDDYWYTDEGIPSSVPPNETIQMTLNELNYFANSIDNCIQILRMNDDNITI